MPVEYLRVMSAAKLQILPHTRTADKLESFRSGLLCLLHNVRIRETVLQKCKHRMLMSRYHNVDIIRIDDPQTNRRKADLRLAKHDVIEQVRQHKPIDPC